MEDLIKVVKTETIRTVTWVVIASTVAIAVYYLVW